jgi:hypothetical protein
MVSAKAARRVSLTSRDLRIRFGLPKEATELCPGAQTVQWPQGLQFSEITQIHRSFFAPARAVRNPPYSEENENARGFYFLLIKKQ